MPAFGVGKGSHNGHERQFKPVPLIAFNGVRTDYNLAPRAILQATSY
jgi:hypothetical protein